MAEPILRIRNLHARVGETEILRGVNLDVYPGQVHAIMGPNGSGKSTLAAVLAGREDYEVTEGEVLFDGKNLLEMDPEERAREGLFLAFQYPVEIPRRLYRDVPQNCAQRAPQASWPRAARCDGVHEPDARASSAGED